MKKVEVFIKPKPIEATTLDGEKRKYIISRFDAETGREIVTQYPTTGAPKIGDYEQNARLMFKLMEYVAAVPVDEDGKEGDAIVLESRDLFRNHVPDYEVGMQIEKAMMEYNTSFFSPGKISNLLDLIVQNAAKLISSMSTDSLEPSSRQTKRHS